MSDHLIAEANRNAKALPKMTIPTTKPNDRDLEWYIAECVDLKKQLEMECAAKREHMRIACAEINELKVKAGFYERENAALRADIQAHEQINRQLIEDKRRLDFLGQTKCAYYYEGPCCWRINEDKNTDGDTLRAAIDAARKEVQP